MLIADPDGLNQSLSSSECTSVDTEGDCAEVDTDVNTQTNKSVYVELDEHFHKEFDANQKATTFSIDTEFNPIPKKSINL